MINFKQALFDKLNFKKRSLIYFLIFTLFLISVSVFWINKFSDMKQLPGPMYGGDVYLYYAQFNHIASGGSVFESHQYAGEFAHLPWLMPVLNNLFRILFGLDTFTAFVYFGVILLIFAGLASYFISIKIFHNPLVSLLISISWVTITYPASSITLFNYWVLLPLLPLFFFYKRDKTSQIFMGLFYGICGLSDIISFFSASIFLALLLFLRIYDECVSFNENKLVLKKRLLFSIKEFFKDYWIVFLLGISISMLFWFGLIFIYHANTPNPLLEYVASGLSLGIKGFISLNFDLLKMIFLNFSSNTLNLVFSILIIFGAFILLNSLKNKKEYWAIVFLFIIAYVGYTHPVITKPLIGLEVGHYGFPRILPIAKMFVIFAGIAYLLNKSNKKIIFGVTLIVLLLFGIKFGVLLNDYNVDRWIQVGYTTNDNIKLETNLADFIKSSTSIDGVFITTHEEVGFALNGLTGRKVLFLRRTHSNPFIDINQRVADGAVILYGNNSQLRKELIKKYKIDYFFTDPYSLQSSQECLKIWGKIDKIPKEQQDISYSCLRTDVKFKDYLSENGIQVKEVFARLDPASITAPRFNILIIKPENIRLELVPIQEFKYENTTYLGIYKVGGDL